MHKKPKQRIVEQCEKERKAWAFFHITVYSLFKSGLSLIFHQLQKNEKRMKKNCIASEQWQIVYLYVGSTIEWMFVECIWKVWKWHLLLPLLLFIDSANIAAAAAAAINWKKSRIYSLSIVHNNFLIYNLFIHSFIFMLLADSFVYFVSIDNFAI